MPSSRRSRRIRVLLLLGAVLALAFPLRGQEASLEYQVKAVYLLNFTRYVDWPPHARPASNNPIYICILGRDPFGNDLDAAVQGKRTQGHPIAVRRVTSVQDAAGCHIVFQTQSEWRSQRETVLSLTERGILTVGDSEQFAREGGVIGFVISNETVRFVVNLRARERAGLTISSRMLSLATDLYEPDRR